MSSPTIILDSGAFSAWSRGAAIDIDAYIAFIFANAEWIDYYINLDVIPGAFGVVPTPQQVEASAEQSWENFLYMERHGLHPMPVFHMGERFAWLQRFVDHGCDYIGISPANDRTTKQKRLWLDRVFTLLGDEEGRPRVKTHALGVTAVPLLIRYPWFSADSSAWATSSGRGNVFVPRLHHGHEDFTRSPLIVYMSGRKRVQSTNEFDYRRLPASLKEYVDTFIRHAQTTPDECLVSCQARAQVCAYFFQCFERAFVSPTTFKAGTPFLFEDQ